MKPTHALIQIWENSVIAFHSLISNKLRAFLTILGITIGTATIITILTITDGLDTAFFNQISSLGSDNLHISKIPWDAGLDFFKYRNRKDITIKELAVIQKNARLIKAVTPIITTNGTTSHKSKSLNAVGINGTDHQYKDVYNAYPELGRFMTKYEVEHRKNVCVIGWEVAEKLFASQDPLAALGKKIYVDNNLFRVIGVMEKRGNSLGGNLDTQIFIPLGAFRKSYGIKRSLTICVKVLNVSRLEDTTDELRGILRRARKVLPGQEDDFAINQQDVLIDLYRNLTSGLFAVAVGIGVITLLVGGIGIMNIMLVAVKERTREIGLRKAIGAKKRDLIWQFLVESVLISAMGGLIGIGIGILMSKFISGVSPLPASISLPTFLAGLLFTSGVGIFFGLYPAVKAAGLNAIDGLRYE
jgi:putative ABC transport system permease protein